MPGTDLSRFTADVLAGLPTAALAELYEAARLDVTAPGAATVERAFGLRVEREATRDRLVVGEWSYSWNDKEGIIRARADLTGYEPKRWRKPNPKAPVRPFSAKGRKSARRSKRIS